MTYLKTKILITSFTFKIITASIISFLSLTQASAQVAICGANSDSPDGFALVALSNIHEGTNIFFTDLSYVPESNIFESLDINGNPSTNEGVVQVTWNGTWQMGTIIRVVETSNSVFTVTSSANGPMGADATIVYAGDGFSLTGSEGLSVFTSSSLTDPANNIDAIFGYINMVESESPDPNPNDDPDCPCVPNFVEIDFGSSSVDGYNFNPAQRSGNVPLATYNNPANWVTSSSNVELDLTEFADIALPVRLINFSGENVDGMIKLEWATASETNNNHFDLERSSDGKSFSIIGRIDGSGSTYSTVNYSFVDEKPLKGSNYYRLKQVDHDGKFDFSKSIVVQNLNESNDLMINPNPFGAIVTITLNKAFSKDTSYEIFDMLRGVVQSGLLKKDVLNHILDTSGMGSGTYIFHVNDGSESIYRKITKG